MGFNLKKCKRNRHILVDSPDIISQNAVYVLGHIIVWVQGKHGRHVITCTRNEIGGNTSGETDSADEATLL
jgi:hypothetical protein